MKIPILMYRQIDQPPQRGTALRGLIVAPSSFAWQMRLLRWMNLQGLSMRDLEPYLQGRKQGKVKEKPLITLSTNVFQYLLKPIFTHEDRRGCGDLTGFFGPIST
ncbi:MAG: hypothetical protein K9J50_10830 [Sulfuritalea sp.]|nr:hypothetical protein [Sulfuritalea sp.]